MNECSSVQKSGPGVNNFSLLLAPAATVSDSNLEFGSASPIDSVRLWQQNVDCLASVNCMDYTAKNRYVRPVLCELQVVV